MMHEILKRVWEEEQMPEECRENLDRKAKKCRNFRDIKLLEHGMKMFEKILEHRLRKPITVNNIQF